jgi:hypothetical protein
LPNKAEGCHDFSKDLTFDELKRDLIKSKIKTSGQMLEFFSKTPRYQAFVDNPVLLKESHALHGSEVSPLFPRIESINGNLAMHMTADPSKIGHQAAEFVEYLPEKGTYRFTVINFVLADTENMFIEDGGYLPGPIEELHANALGEFHQCNFCHNHGRPMWVASDAALTATYGGGSNEIKPGTEEFDQFQGFLKTMADSHLGQIYRHLNIRTEVNSSGTISFSNAPNTRYMENFHEKSTARLAKKLQLDLEYSSFQYALLGALFNCEEIEDFLPPMAKEQHETNMVAGFKEWYSWSQHVIHLDKVPQIIRDNVIPRKGSIPTPTEFYTEPQLIQSKLMSPVEIFKLGIASANIRRKGGPLSLDYSSTMAKLRYLYEYRLEQEPEQIARMLESDLYLESDEEERRKLVRRQTFPEFYNWFPSTGHYEDHPEMYSLRGEMSSINEILKCHVGPTFLKENPELDFFEQSEVGLDRLKISKKDFCSKLKAKSDFE